MKVTVIGGELEAREIARYVDLGLEQYGRMEAVTIRVDGEFVEVDYDLGHRPFERIRRITGYLAARDRWNPAKRAEGKDRVTHR